MKSQIVTLFCLFLALPAFAHAEATITVKRDDTVKKKEITKKDLKSFTIDKLAAAIDDASDSLDPKTRVCYDGKVEHIENILSAIADEKPKYDLNHFSVNGNNELTVNAKRKDDGYSRFLRISKCD